MAEPSPHEQTSWLIRRVVNLVELDNREPHYCDGSCPMRDGQRCRLSGSRPPDICDQGGRVGVVNAVLDGLGVPR